MSNLQGRYPIRRIQAWVDAQSAVVLVLLRTYPVRGAYWTGAAASKALLLDWAFDGRASSALNTAAPAGGATA